MTPEDAHCGRTDRLGKERSKASCREYKFGAGRKCGKGLE